jgi:hypothetical protein
VTKWLAPLCVILGILGGCSETDVNKAPESQQQEIRNIVRLEVVQADLYCHWVVMYEENGMLKAKYFSLDSTIIINDENRLIYTVPGGVAKMWVSESIIKGK